MKVDYVSGEAPPAYRCRRCNATGGKLWRQYQTFNIELLCVDCAVKDQGQTYVVDQDGRHRDKQLRMLTDSIEWLVPAVPIEDGDAFWGYTSVPEEGYVWWRKLPLRGRPGQKEWSPAGRDAQSAKGCGHGPP